MSDGQEPAKAKLSESGVDSYKRLSEVFHTILSELSLDDLLERIAEALSDLVPYDFLTFTGPTTTGKS